MRSHPSRPATVAITAVALALTAALPAAAHNAGHFTLLDGTCHEVGSFKHGPLVGADGTRLDLLPATPMDEYGASFAAFQGSTSLLPGPCPS
jgi:hypothetical protein